MNYTKENVEIAKSVFDILADKKCTIAEASEILSFIGMAIRNSATVQSNDTSKELFTFKD